jgi:hypothetical protein
MRLVGVLVLAGCGFRPGALGNPADLDADAVGSASDASIDAVTCTDGVKNGTETDIDCGGTCGPCAIGMQCTASTDCAAGVCDPTVCRPPVSCRELRTLQPLVADGAYAIDPDGAASAAAVTTYCDMTTDGGGWTLVGKVDGRHEMHTTWLITNTNTSAMTTPAIGTAGFACIDAVRLAVDVSSEIRFSNSARTRWVKWQLPASRAIGTFWRHTVGYTTINGATQASVTATGWNGATSTCYQNLYGVMNWDGHGGAYPAVGRNTSGNTQGNDLCMSIGTMTSGGTINGFTSNGNQFDAPIDETTWPNTAYNVTPHVAVWLR